MNVLFDNRQDLEIEEETLSLMIDAIQKTLEFERESLNKEISISFVTNEEIKSLNKNFRDKDAVTDVLSFPIDFEFSIGDDDLPLGDIIISIEKAKEQSELLGHSLRREIIYLTIHSMFHLLGYDHLNEDEKRIMREKEKSVVRLVGIYKSRNL